MLNLEEPSRERLTRSPLDLVVCQVRHERNEAATDARTALEVQRALQDAYPVAEEIVGTELRVAGGPEGMQTSFQESIKGGWRFQSSDRKWTVTVAPEAYSLETTEYLDWDDFSKRLKTLTTAVGGLFEVAVEKRLGLRYIDKIDDPRVETLKGWEQWVHPTLIGPAAHPDLGSTVDGLQGVSRFDVGDGQYVVLRHAYVKEDGRWILVMDHDCYREVAVEFSEDGIMTGAEALHDVALQVFQAMISPDLFDYLRGKAE